MTDKNARRGYSVATWPLLLQAAARVPGGTWVFAPVALGSAAALVLGLFFGSAKLAFFGTTFALAFAILFYGFAKGTEGITVLVGPLRTLVWVVTCLFALVLATIYACVFWGQPLDLRYWIAAKAVSTATATATGLAPCREALSWSAEAEASTLASYPSTNDPTARALCGVILAKMPDDPAINGLYARALVVEGRLEEAIARFERAAEKGDIHSNLVLGLYFLLWKESDREKGIGYLTAAANQGDVQALVELGRTYEIGRIGPVNYSKAATYYLKASTLGSAEASRHLGQLYQFGLGVDVDPDKARTYLRAAAATGDVEAVAALNQLGQRE